jgi:hypothetical protein
MNEQLLKQYPVLVSAVYGCVLLLHVQLLIAWQCQEYHCRTLSVGQQQQQQQQQQWKTCSSYSSTRCW